MRLNDRKITLDGVFKKLHNIFIDLWPDLNSQFNKPANYVVKQACKRKDVRIET